MAKWKFDMFDEKDDKNPARSEVVDASSELEAAEMLVKRLRGSEKRGDATKQDDVFRTGDVLGGSKKLG